MSPEQAGGQQRVDGRSDIYSLGCVLYEMLAGEPPFTGPTPQSVIARRFVEPPPPVRRLRPAVPPALEAALSRALTAAPADRFQTAAEFRDALAQPFAGGPAPVQKGDRPRPLAGPATLRHLLLGLALLLAAGLTVLLWRPRQHPGSTETSEPRQDLVASAQRVAVLPFKYQGDSAENDLADGITDEVRGKLAALPGLEVIASPSSEPYRAMTKPLGEVARELGVRYLLVGRVRAERPGGKDPTIVRVSPELIEVAAGRAPTTRWQAPFEAPLTGVFEVQAAIASRVAEALGVALGVKERQALARPLTGNLAAYKAYLRGEAIWPATGAPNASIARQAIPYYEQAVALDSGLVEAWYRLAGAHLRIYGSGGTPSPAEGEAARTAATRILGLAPERPEGRVALGYYYLRVRSDTKRALEQFTLALAMAPDNIDALGFAAYAEQYLGRWDAGLAHLRRAATLDPRSAGIAASLQQALLLLRRYPEAHAAADRALALAPGSARMVHSKAMVYLAQGDLGRARAVLREGLERIDPAALVSWFGYAADLYWVLDEPEQQLLLRLPPSAYDNNRASWGLVLAQTYALRGDVARSRIYADSARLAFEEQLRGAPTDAQLHALYGLSLAYLGRKAEAVREGEHAVVLAPLTERAADGAYVRHQLVRIFLLTGEHDRALDQLEPLLKIPYHLSPGWLKIDPNFNTVRRDARFQRLVAARHGASADDG